MEDTRAYVREHCLLANAKRPPAKTEFAPLLGILAPILIGKAIGGIAGAFRKAGADEVVKKIGSSPIYLYARTGDTPPALKMHPSLGCVILIHGVFDTKGAEAEPGKEPPAVYKEDGIFAKADPEQAAKRIQRLNDNKIPVKKVHVLAEMEVNRSEDKTALLYQAKFLWIEKFLGTRSSPERGLVVNVNIVGAGAKPEEPIISGALLNFGEVKAEVLGPDKLKSVTSDWAGGIGIGKESKEAFTALSSNVKVLNYMPVTLKAGFAETAKGNAIAKFIGEVLEAGKADLTKLTNEQVSPTERDKADAKDEADLETLAVKEETAYSAYLTAKVNQKKEADGTPPPTAERVTFLQFERERTKRLWCNAIKAYKNTMTILPAGRPAGEANACFL